MMKALYSGVSGLKTHQTRMDVIGNNIANVNTVAYKSSSMSFQDLMYQTTSYATGADATTGRGGVNANQIGLGVTTGAISNTITTQGAPQTTNDAFDLSIQGGSFFVVNNGTENLYTRAGAFYVDGVGNLAMKTTGYNVMGWAADEDGNLADDITALKIMSAENQVSNPEATELARITGILDKNGSKLNNGGQSVSLQVYDDLGYSYTCKYRIVPVQDDMGNNIEGSYTIALEGLFDSNGDTLGAANYLKQYNNGTLPAEYDPSNNAFKAEEITFGNSIVGSQDYSITTSITNAGTTSQVTTYIVKNYDGTTKNFTDKEEAMAYYNQLTGLEVQANQLGENDGDTVESSFAVYGFSLDYDVSNGSLKGIGGNESKVVMNLDNVKASMKAVTIDFSASTNVANGGVATIDGKAGDADGNKAGKKVGTMNSISIDGNGYITATYDNGNSRTLGLIAVANFANASGLEKQGENLYSTSLNSGEATIGEIAAQGEKMTNGTLEMSNVDLATEFTEMITTQRGFQANSRIITTSDTLLEELVNLKR